MPFKDVKTQDGNTKRVVADNDADLKEAVKVAEQDGAPVYPNINHPVAKGHDLVAVGPDASKVLVDGTGAHNSPENAVNADGSENGDPKVTAAGLNEVAYKQVPQNGGDEGTDPRVATDAEVKEAKSDSAPANEVTPEGAEVKEDKKESK